MPCAALTTGLRKPVTRENNVYCTIKDRKSHTLTSYLLFAIVVLLLLEAQTVKSSPVKELGFSLKNR